MNYVNPQFQQVCEEITAGMPRIPIPGLAVGVWHAGNEQAAGFGVTSILFEIAKLPQSTLVTACLQLAGVFYGVFVVTLIKDKQRQKAIEREGTNSRPPRQPGR